MFSGNCFDAETLCFYLRKYSITIIQVVLKNNKNVNERWLEVTGQILWTQFSTNFALKHHRCEKISRGKRETVILRIWLGKYSNILYIRGKVFLKVVHPSAKRHYEIACKSLQRLSKNDFPRKPYQSNQFEFNMGLTWAFRSLLQILEVGPTPTYWKWKRLYIGSLINMPYTSQGPSFTNIHDKLFWFP